MDKAGAKSHYAPEGVSVRNGPILDDKMDVDEPSINGTGKRKARVSAGKPVNYNVDESESSEDAVPLVLLPSPPILPPGRHG
jgi:DNA topoisomerase-1